MKIINNVLSDRGSKYSVAGGPVFSSEEASAFIRDLKRLKKFARATHNSWGLLLDENGLQTQIKADDGEAGAGAVILRMLERENLTNHIVVVTRWFGGVKLGGDRFRHVQTAVRAYLSEVSPPN
jgi:putative IMPACT (imprinted ancient) family translation regulator